MKIKKTIIISEKYDKVLRKIGWAIFVNLTLLYCLTDKEYYARRWRHTQPGIPWPFHCALDDWHYEKLGGYAERVKQEYGKRFVRPKHFYIFGDYGEIPPMEDF